jgi:Zn-dependent peptidase ImmA (M78 family)
MSDNLCVPFIPDDTLRLEARGFLTKYHPDGTIPVPIEEIIELRFRMDIVPTPGLKSNFEVDAYISRDMESIYIDEYIYEHVRTRYRYSLAHELAHAVLHQKTFRKLVYDGIDGWKRIQESFSEKDYSWLEYQAYAFAGLILVPPDSLASSFEQAKKRARQSGLDLENLTDECRRSIAGYLARDFFDVSTDVVDRRLEKDGLWPKKNG